ncbi:glycosyltransferase family 8 protein [Brachyspira aalborgi]|uniref:Glycosyltransferase family 8 protein n=1 Tax=Brachyspira aalborgi TaxID=29522 RepID=A0A5C8G2R4_9SPIR|nr:glycosyltransferase family 8 protein [Brachyspira aalborgi]TXJ55897.1 glycosyltransferase family 8 protein [Brachyspira aalborgi]
MNEVVIAYITDDNYVMPTIVSITSAIMNKNESSIYKIFIIGVSINNENKKIIEEFISKNINDKIYLNIMHFNQHYNFDDSHPYVTSAAIFKFDIANILSDYDKVLYIDCDTIILKDLTELFEINLNDYYAAVVKDYIVYVLHENLLLGIEDYFNSGVMLLNTKLLRKDNVKELLLYYKINKDRRHFMDQDCFNYIFNSKVKFIKPKYNYMRTICDYDRDSLDNFFECDTSENIVILHLVWFKPWDENVVEAKYFYDFWKYYQYTDYFKNNPIWAINKISEQKVKYLENNINTKLEDIDNKNIQFINNINQKLKELDDRINILENYNCKRYSENWIKLFGIYNTKDYLMFYLFGIKISFKMNENRVNKLAWWIPVRKWRDNFRNKMLNI